MVHRRSGFSDVRDLFGFLVLGVALRSSGRNPSIDLVGACSSGALASFFSLEMFVVELRLHPQEGLVLGEKSVAPASWAGDGGGYVAPFLEASSPWRARIQ
jgi:hypothetical protein